jgi:hypothetical protein
VSATTVVGGLFELGWEDIGLLLEMLFNLSVSIVFSILPRSQFLRSWLVLSDPPFLLS